jgi:hypothetical protein
MEKIEPINLRELREKARTVRETRAQERLAIRGLWRRQAESGGVPDAEVLQNALLLDEWAPGETYPAGALVRAGKLVYRVIAAHTANAAYPPETAFAYYRQVELEHAGTQDDPIPYPETAGVVAAVQSGKYYTYKGLMYLAKADMPDCVWPPDTPGLWQWEAVIN